MAVFKSLLLCLLTVSPLASAVGWDAVVPNITYDVLIVGGGPAGLSSLSALGRTRRNTLLLDSGEYRNQDTRRIHDVIALDGIVPADFRYQARQLISQYSTAYMKNATVTTIRRINNNTRFEATTSDNKVYIAKKLILGTGVVDIIPTTPGVREAWARGIFWCPWCDGWEHADQSLGFLGSIVDVVGSTLDTYTLNTDLIAFVNGTHTPANEAILDINRPGWRQQLKGYNVTLENRTIERVTRLQDGAVFRNATTGAEYDRFSVTLADKTTILRDAFLTNFKNQQRSYLGKQIGLQYYGDRMDVVAASMRTNVAGVYAIGDANADNSTNVPHAMFSGKKAAVYVHVELERERAATFVTKREERDLEALMGRDLEDLYENLRK